MTKYDKLVDHIRRRPSSAKFRDVQSLLESHGWMHASTKGSHARFKKPGYRSWTVPVHNGKVKRHYVDDLCELLGLDNEETETE